MDGTKAATRLGKPVTTRWANERFRQTLLLVHEFRSEWPAQALVSADDMEMMRVALDVALAEAIREGHVGDIYE